MQDKNLKVFNMVKEINESKTLIKHISYECRCEFDGRNCNSKQKSDNGKCQCECEYLKNHTCTKSIIDDLLVTCDEIVDRPETVSISFTNKKFFLLLCVVLLGIACLLLLVFIAVRYHMKRGLIIPYLLSN